MYHIFFYTPKESCEAVKEAMFSAGGGKIGNYRKCSWQVLGEGQFEPLEGANPHIGEIDKIERVQEYRVEMVCQEQCLNDVIEALKLSHPYEEVAYGVIKLEIKD